MSFGSPNKNTVQMVSIVSAPQIGHVHMILLLCVSAQFFLFSAAGSSCAVVHLVQRGNMSKSFRTCVCLSDRKKTSCSNGLNCLLCVSVQTKTSCSICFMFSLFLIEQELNVQKGSVLLSCVYGPKQRYCSNGLNRFASGPQKLTFFS